MRYLLSEATASQPIEIIEAAGEGNKRTRFRAKVTTVDAINQNGRVYPKAIFERELPKLTQESHKSERIGAVDHPDKGISPKIEALAIRWIGFVFSNNDVIGEGEILPTTAGKVLEDLIRSDVEIGFSSRGQGSASPGEFNGQAAAIIDEDYGLLTFDAVVQPSVAKARIFAYEQFEPRHADLLERLEAILTTNPDALEAIVERVSAESALAEADTSLEEFDADESDIALEAKWTTKYKDALPDSSFLYVKGDVRKFPYKDADGKVDLPHLRNALARIPDAKGISDAEKAELTAKAKDILKANGGEDKMDAVGGDAPVAETPEAEETTSTESPAVEASAPAAEAATEEQAPVVNPLEERVTALEGELTEARTRNDALNAQVTALNEDASSLSALLVAIKTAILAELADEDWDDTATLASFAQCANWRRGAEAADAVADPKDESAQPPSDVKQLEDALLPLLKEYRANKVRAHISKITRVERFGRAIASALEESAASIKEADEMFPVVRELIQAKLNAVPGAVTQGVVQDNAPRWTAAQIEMRRLAGHLE